MSPIEQYSKELCHYGVLGMKWGVRKNPSRAYEKASKKLAKLDKKVEKQGRKANKKIDKADRTLGTRRRRRAMERASISSSNYRRRVAKANRWYKSMEKTFSKTDISLTSEQQSLGKKYADALRMRMMFY